MPTPHILHTSPIFLTFLEIGYSQGRQTKSSLRILAFSQPGRAYTGDSVTTQIIETTPSNLTSPVFSSQGLAIKISAGLHNTNTNVHIDIDKCLRDLHRSNHALTTAKMNFRSLRHRQLENMFFLELGTARYVRQLFSKLIRSSWRVNILTFSSPRTSCYDRNGNGNGAFLLVVWIVIVTAVWITVYEPTECHISFFQLCFEDDKK